MFFLRKGLMVCSLFKKSKSYCGVVGSIYRYPYSLSISITAKKALLLALLNWKFPNESIGDFSINSSLKLEKFTILFMVANLVECFGAIPLIVVCAIGVNGKINAKRKQ